MTMWRYLFLFSVSLLLMACSLGPWSYESPRVSSLERGDSAAYGLLFQLSNDNIADAQYALAYLFATGNGVAKKPDLAQTWLEKAAKQGYPAATDALASPQKAWLYPPLLAALYSQPRYSPAVSQSPRRYTIQLASGASEADVQRVIEAYHVKDTVIVRETRVAGKPWYVVTRGVYARHVQAVSALKNVPTEWASLHPFIRPIQTLSH